MLLTLLELFLAAVANVALASWLLGSTADHNAASELTSAVEPVGTTDNTAKPTAPALILPDANAVVDSSPPEAIDGLPAEIKSTEVTSQPPASELKADSGSDNGVVEPRNLKIMKTRAPKFVASPEEAEIVPFDAATHSPRSRRRSKLSRAVLSDDMLDNILEETSPNATHESYLVYLSRKKQIDSRFRLGTTIVGAYVRAKGRTTSDRASPEATTSTKATSSTEASEGSKGRVAEESSVPDAGHAFVGKWAVAKRENFSAYLNEVVGLNWATRRIAEKLMLTPEFWIEDDELHCITTCPGAKPVHEVLRVGEISFHEPNQRVEVTVRSRWEAYKFKSTRKTPSGLAIRLERYIDSNDMLHISQDWGGAMPFVTIHSRRTV